MYSTLRKYCQGTPVGTPVRLDLGGGNNVQELIASLGIPPEEVVYAAVNGHLAGKEHPLQEGDQVALFGPVAGG